jgi:hypothetical protein
MMIRRVEVHNDRSSEEESMKGNERGEEGEVKAKKEKQASKGASAAEMNLINHLSLV